MTFVGNSFTQNLGELPNYIQYLLDQHQPTNTTTLGPPTPNLATTLGDTDGWFTGQGTSEMCFAGNGTTTTDALDHIATNGVGTYDSVVITSNYRQDGDSVSPPVTREDVGYGTNNQWIAYVEWLRLIAQELDSLGYTGPMIVRMSQEGENWNGDTDFSDATRLQQVKMAAARRLESEANTASVPLSVYNVPDHYVWYRLCIGNEDGLTFGNGPQTPVPSFTSLVHQASLQPSSRNVSWCNRSNNDTNPPLGDPPNRNSHQNFLATLINTWTWGYAVWGIDPRGDTSFDLPFTIPGGNVNSQNFINTDGTRIYGGQAQGIGNVPYDPVSPYNLITVVNAIPDAELDLPWTAAIRTEIQDRIVAAVDDYYAGTTGVEPP